MVSKKKLEDAAEFAKKTYDRLGKGQSKIKSNVRKWNRMWEGKSVGKHYTGGMANLIVNETNTAVETYVALMKKLRTVVEAPFEVAERKKVIDLPENKERLFEIQSLVKFLLDKDKVDSKFDRGFRKLCIEGTLIYKVIYDVSKVKYSSYEGKVTKTPLYKPQDKPYGVLKDEAKPVGFDIEHALQPVEIEEKFDSPKLIIKRLEDMYYARDCEDWDKQTAVGEIEKDVPLDSLLIRKNEDGKPLYSNLKVLKDKVFTKASEHEKKEGVKVNLFHLWAKYDPDENGIPSVYEIICDVDHWVCLMCRPNPYDHGTIPYRQVKLYEIDGRADGMGIPEFCYTMQVELNDNRNKIADTITLNLAQMKTIKRTANIDKNQLKPRPFGYVEVTQHEDVKNWEVDVRAVQSGIMLEKILKEDFQIRTGATMPLQGTGAGANTLGQSEILLYKGLDRLFNILDKVEREFLQEVYRLFYLLAMQYRDVKWELMILGKEAQGLQTIDKVRVFADVDFIPVGTKYIKQNYLQSQQDLTLLNIVSQIPRYMPLADSLIMEIAKSKGREKEFREAMQQAQQMQVQQQQVAGGEAAQEQAGLTPQSGATTGMNELLRGAGSPARNQYGGSPLVS